MSTYFTNTIARIGIDVQPLQEKMQVAKGAIVEFKDGAMVSLKNLRAPNVNITNLVESIQLGAKTTLDFARQSGESMIEFQKRVATELAKVGVDYKLYSQNLEEASTIQAKFAHGELQVINGLRAEGEAAEEAESKFATLKEMLIGFGELYIIEKLMELGKEFVSLGEKVQDTELKFDFVFGEMAEKAKEFSESTSKSLGVAKTQLENLFTKSYDVQFNLGFSADQSLAMSENITKLSYDFAKLRGIDVQESFDLINKSMMGTARGLRNLGIVVSNYDMEQKALKLGIHRTSKEWTDAEKSLISYNIVMDRTANLQGFYSKTNETLSTTIARLKADGEALMESIGTKTTPIITKLVGALDTVVNVIASNLEPILTVLSRTMQIVASATAAWITYMAVGAIIEFATGLQKLITIIRGVAEAGLLLDTIMVIFEGLALNWVGILAAIGAGAAVFIGLNSLFGATAESSEKLDSSMSKNPFKDATKGANELNKAMTQTVASFDQVHNLSQSTSGTGNAGASGGNGAMSDIKLPDMSAAKNPLTTMFDGLKEKFDGIITKIQGAWSTALAWLGEQWDEWSKDPKGTTIKWVTGAWDWMKDEWTKATTSISGKWTAWLNSPGVQNKIKWVEAAWEQTKKDWSAVLAEVKLEFGEWLQGTTVYKTIKWVEATFEQAKKNWTAVLTEIKLEFGEWLESTSVYKAIKWVSAVWEQTKKDWAAALAEAKLEFGEWLESTSVYKAIKWVSAVWTQTKKDWSAVLTESKLEFGEWLESSTPFKVIKWVQDAWQWAKDEWNTLLVDIGNLWEGFLQSPAVKITVKWATDAWDGIKSAFKSVLNELIAMWDSFSAGVNNTINGAREMIGLSGNTKTLPVITPFANGGIVTMPTMALIGEAGPEAVIPLSQLNSLNNAIGSGDGGNKPIVVNLQLESKLNGRTVARELRQFTIHENSRVGAGISSADSSVNYPR